MLGTAQAQEPPTGVADQQALLKSHDPKLAANKKLVALKLNHTIKYDSLREEFQVTLSERGNQTFILKDFAKAQEMMADVSNVQVLPLKQMERNNQYHLRIKAELNKVTLPLYLHYVLFFISLFTFHF